MTADEFRSFIANAIVFVGVCFAGFILAPVLIVVMSVIAWNWWKILFIIGVVLLVHAIISRFWPKAPASENLPR